MPEHHAALEPEEFDRRLAQALAELDGEEGERIDELLAWFGRRYPTPLERLRYARRAYEQAVKLRGAVLRPR